jgi:hypothetical protein
MSRLDAFFEGWGFRTNRPTFEPGEEFTAFVTGYEDDTGIVRLGDTVLRLSEASPDLVDTQVRLRVEAFDGNDHAGRATVLEELGGGTY